MSWISSEKPNTAKSNGLAGLILVYYVYIIYIYIFLKNKKCSPLLSRSPSTRLHKIKHGEEKKKVWIV